MENVLVKVENKDGILVVSSNRVAVELGIRHDNLLNKIVNIIDVINTTLIYIRV